MAAGSLARTPVPMHFEEQAPEATRDLLAEVTELLLAGGYFRARIADLTPFDKVRAT